MSESFLNRPNKKSNQIPYTDPSDRAPEEERKSDRLKDRKDHHTHTHTHIYTHKSSRVNQEQTRHLKTNPRPMALEQRRR